MDGLLLGFVPACAYHSTSRGGHSVYKISSLLGEGITFAAADVQLLRAAGSEKLEALKVETAAAR